MEDSPQKPEPNPDDQPKQADTEVSSPPQPPEPVDESENLSEVGTADEISEKELGTPQAPPPTPVKPKKSKRKLLIILLVLLLIAGGVGGWYYWNKHKASPQPAQDTQTAQQQTQAEPAAPTYAPNTVAYAYAAKVDDPLTIYWRAATGGDRKEVQKLAKNVYPSDSDVNGSVVVISAGPDVLLSADAGKTYSKVFSGTGTSQITSVSISSDRSHVAFAYLPSVGGKNTVKSIDLKGSDQKDLFTSSSAGVFINGWDYKQQQIVYGEGCFNCDGGRTGLYLRNITKNTVTQLLKAVNIKELSSVVVSGDFTTLIYVKATVNPVAAGNTPSGNFVAAPYTISTINLGNLKETALTIFGSKSEKNQNGTYKTRNVIAGFLAGSNTPYYTNDNALYVVKSGQPSNVYTATKNFQYVLYVNDDTVIAGNGDSVSDYALTNYTISTKKSVSIFSGDNNTYIFGLTTL